MNDAARGSGPGDESTDEFAAGVGGGLWIVGTPIGNLEDLSPRAAATLDAVDVVACEDTRRTGRLLAHLGVTGARLVVVNDHTESDETPALVEEMSAGSRVALVTDAGMPTISDPGAELVAAAVEAGLPVDIAPGPTAVSTALALSGLSGHRWAFEGFLPRKGEKRARRLATIATDERIMVLYEAPGRVAATLADLASVCGTDRRATVARELTKLHEEVHRGTLGELVAGIGATTVKGEFVIVVAGAGPAAPPTAAEIDEALVPLLDAGRSTRDAADAVAADLGVSRRVAYEAALGVNRDRNGS